ENDGVVKIDVNAYVDTGSNNRGLPNHATEQFEILWHRVKGNEDKLEHRAIRGYNDGSGLLHGAGHASARAIENDVNGLAKFSVEKAPRGGKPERNGILIDRNRNKIVSI
ncbi:hypothetical protein, partial [Halococcus hamelinensis]